MSMVRSLISSMKMAPTTEESSAPVSLGASIIVDYSRIRGDREKRISDLDSTSQNWLVPPTFVPVTKSLLFSVILIDVLENTAYENSLNNRNTLDQNYSDLESYFDINIKENIRALTNCYNIMRASSHYRMFVIFDIHA